MSRIFVDRTKRKSACLDGMWFFKTDADNAGKEQGFFMGFTDGMQIAVPSVWNTEFGLIEYNGAVWYSKDFYFEGGNLRLNFEAVMTYAEVWLDGKLLGDHYGGFSAFDFYVNNVETGFHNLTLRVDNSFDKNSIPQKKVDWYHYGGIIRSVYAEKVAETVVTNLRFDYNLNDALTLANAKITAELFNSESYEITSPVTFFFDSKEIFKTDITLSAGETKKVVSPEFSVENIRLWDIGKPELYSILVATNTDDLYDRVGFRKIEVKDQKILLNGNQIEIRGVNRHEEYPDFGFAFPKSLMNRDIDIILNLGCNAIRGSHYPNSKYFVDLLDSKGILFWSEIPMWGVGFTAETLGLPTVIERGLTMHKEMLKQYFNHPSIIIWGMHNEIPTEAENAYNISKLFYNFLKENGGNRIVTYATYKPMEDICLEFCDIICLNQYYGWYYGNNDSWQEALNEFRERRNALGYGHKPIIMSEFGCAAIYGDHTFTNIRWTEEYQAEMLSKAITTFHNDSMVCGFYVWQYADMRTCWEAGMTRARGFNNKGLVNEHRKPKASYFAVKKLYDEFKGEQ
ncbi:MAG: beta-glucuronidase [Ruminococcaceae bacterium]|nr:beta-glucuronidase [Oscillospiraceae bacterium]